MSTRFQVSGDPLPVLKLEHEVNEKLKKNGSVLILFNERDPITNGIEAKFRSWRAEYDRNTDLHIYKCIVALHSSDLKRAFNIQNYPTFVFFRGGEEVARLENAEKVASPSVNANEAGSVTSSPVIDAEQQLRNWLDKNCKCKATS